MTLTSNKLKKLKNIFVHILVWASIIFICNSGNLSWQGYNSADGTLLIPSLYGNAFNAFLVYFNALYLYRHKNKFRLNYWLLAILSILIISLLEALVDYYYANLSGVLELHFDIIKSDLEGETLAFNVEKSLPYLAYIGYLMDDILIHIIFWFLSFTYILPLETVKNRALKQTLEREKLEAEVKFLKAQINPHTLFNGINSIYHLIDKDKNKAKEVLVRFSDLLRYQIYDCSDDTILLSNEIQFLDNYFDLEKIRKGADVNIEFDYNINDTSNLKIAPLLLIPFIENAFKFVSNHDEKDLNFIKCKIIITENELHFYIDNSVENIEKEDLKNGGIGLQNVKKRLQLIYPDKHKLNISSFNDVFSVMLKIELA